MMPILIPAPATPMPSLTERQSEVLRMIALGMTNGEIGGVLHLAVATVKGYVGKLLEAMGATSRAHAVTLAFQWGLLTTATAVEPTPQVRVSPDGVVVIRKRRDAMFPWQAWNLDPYTDAQVEDWTPLVPATNGGAS